MLIKAALNIKFHPIHSELASNWRQRGRTRLDGRRQFRKRSSEDRRRNWIGPIKTHCYKKSGTNSIFSTSNERIFSGKEKRNTCRIRSYITRMLNVRLNFIEEGKFQLICNPLLQRYYWNVNSLETLSTRTIGTSYLQPLGSTLKLLACYSFVAIMQLFGHSRQFS